MDKDNKKDIWWKVLIIVIIILLLFFGGFWTGRKTMKLKTVTVIEYVELPPIHDTIYKPKPKYIEVPADTASIIQDCIEKGLYTELFPWKHDTVFTHQDTTLILSDWSTKRIYKETLFDIDTIGKCDISATVQYNRINSMDYTYTPIQKQTTTTIIKERQFEPFIGGGITIGINNINQNINNVSAGAALQGGFYIKQHYGISLQYQYMFNTNNNNQITGQFLYKF